MRYRVTVEQVTRDVYIVEAESPEDAAAKWSSGCMDDSVTTGMDVVNVVLDDGGAS